MRAAPAQTPGALSAQNPMVLTLACRSRLTQAQYVPRPIGVPIERAARSSSSRGTVGNATSTMIRPTHITHIFQKLNLRDRAQAVVLAYQTGVFESES